MKKSTVIVPKASSYNFDNTTMYNLQEKLEIDLITEKFNRSLRPKPTNPLGEPISKPNKNLSMPFFYQIVHLVLLFLFYNLLRQL
jgi:hypothetical protein